MKKFLRGIVQECTISDGYIPVYDQFIIRAHHNEVPDAYFIKMSFDEMATVVIEHALLDIKHLCWFHAVTYSLTNLGLWESASLIITPSVIIGFENEHDAMIGKLQINPHIKRVH